MSSKEEESKKADPELVDPGAEVEEEVELGSVVAQVSDDKIQWDIKLQALEQLGAMGPQYEKWAIKLFWEFLDDVGDDPEQMDIKKLRTKAVAILTDVAKNYLVAAGGEEETISSLLVRKVTELVKKESKRSKAKQAAKMEAELSAAREAKLVHDEVEIGLRERVAGFKEKIKELDESKIVKDMRLMAKETEAAMSLVKASEIALGTSEGELMATKQQHGQATRDLVNAREKLEQAQEVLQQFRDGSDDAVKSNVLLAQFAALRDQMTNQVTMLSEQMAKGNRAVVSTVKEQGEHVVQVLSSEISAKQHRSESMMEDIMGEFMASQQRLNSDGGEEKRERARQMHALQLQTDAEKRESLERKKVEIIKERMVHKEQMTVKSMLFHGFHEWVQHTALHLTMGLVDGSLVGTKSMEQVAPFSNMVLREKDDRGKSCIVPVLTTYARNGQDGQAGYDYDFSPAMPKGLVGLASGPSTLPKVSASENRTRGASASNVNLKMGLDTKPQDAKVQSSKRFETPRRGGSHKKPASGNTRLDEQAAQESPSKASVLATAIKQKRQQKTDAIRRRFQQEAWNEAQAEGNHHSWNAASEEDEFGEPTHFGTNAESDGEFDGSEDERVDDSARKEQVSQTVKDMLDMSANDGMGNDEDSGDESEEDAVYDAEMSEFLSNEMDLHVNPRAALSLCGTARIKVRAQFVLKLMALINTAYQRHLKGKSPQPNAIEKIVAMWEEAKERGFEVEKTTAMSKEVNAWQENAGMTGKNEGRRESMKSYQKEADRYYATHNNRYLAHADSMTLIQCYNFLRCKKVYEAMLFKTNAKTTSWHKQAEVFYRPDSDVKSKGLMEFAYITFGFPIGEAMDVDNKGFYVHERLPTHRGMRGRDYNRVLWHMRGVKFDEHGIPIIEPPKTTKPKRKSEASAEADVDEGLAEGEPVLGINSDEEDSSGTGVTKLKKTKAQKKRDQNNRRLSTAAEEAMSAELLAKDAALQREKDKLQREKDKGTRVYNKVLKDGQTELPDLDGTAAGGYASAHKFIARAKGNLYSALQQIAALEQQANVVDPDTKESVARAEVHWGEAVIFMEIVQNTVENDVKKQRKGYGFELSGEEWAEKVMELFWVEWFETYTEVEETDDASKLLRKELKSVWENCQFWYGTCPMRWLQLLRQMQAAGLKCGFIINERELKEKYLECALPSTPLFNGVSLPDVIKPYFDWSTPAEDELKLTGKVVKLWYQKGGLFADEPLNVGRNYSKLGRNTEMDCDKDCMPDKRGQLRPVPKHRRFKEWGFTAADRSRKARKAADASEVKSATRGKTTRAPALADGKKNAAGHIVPAWLAENFPTQVEDYKPKAAGKAEYSGSLPELPQEAWNWFYDHYPGDDKCVSNPAHNTATALALMAELDMKRCPCICGRRLPGGAVTGEDYTAVVTAADNKKLFKQIVAIQREKQKRWFSDDQDRNEVKEWANAQKRKVRVEFNRTMQERVTAAKPALTSDAATKGKSSLAASQLAAAQEGEAAEKEDVEEIESGVETEDGEKLECMSAVKAVRNKSACPKQGCNSLACDSCDDPRTVMDEYGETMTISGGKEVYESLLPELPEPEEESVAEQVASLSQWVTDEHAPMQQQTDDGGGGKGGKGRGGKGKGGKGKGGGGELNPYWCASRCPTTPTADALDMGAKAFPGLPRTRGSALGESLLQKKGDNEARTVDKAVSMKKFMRKTYHE